MTKPHIVRYDIIDIQTKRVVGTAKTSSGALRSADKRDNAYGAVRFIVKAIWSDQV